MPPESCSNEVNGDEHSVGVPVFHNPYRKNRTDLGIQKTMSLCLVSVGLAPFRFPDGLYVFCGKDCGIQGHPRNVHSTIEDIKQVKGIGGNVGGAVLTGYDYAFTEQGSLPFAQGLGFGVRVLNSIFIAAAATIMARRLWLLPTTTERTLGRETTDTPTAYAKNLIPVLSADDETLVELSDCFPLMMDGAIWSAGYSSTEIANEKARRRRHWQRSRAWRTTKLLCRPVQLLLRATVCTGGR